MIALLEIQYLPPLAYFCVINNAQAVLLERYEHYEKQTFRNRTYVNTAHGRAGLIVPLTHKHGKALISDVRIDYNQKWVNNHWRTIMSAYGNAPFFEYYADDLEKEIYAKYEFLYDLNVHLLSMCLKWLKWNKTITETSSFDKHVGKPIETFRSIINPKNEAYIEKIYKAVPYYQVFGNSFVGNLSIIDLIFCCGPDASRILALSSRRE